MLISQKVFDAYFLTAASYSVHDKKTFQGFDFLAYFTEKKAVKGKSTNSLIMRGVIYHFFNVVYKASFNNSHLTLR